jgi:hypothetical protein
MVLFYDQNNLLIQDARRLQLAVTGLDLKKVLA